MLKPLGPDVTSITLAVKMQVHKAIKLLSVTLTILIECHIVSELKANTEVE